MNQEKEEHKQLPDRLPIIISEWEVKSLRLLRTRELLEFLDCYNRPSGYRTKMIFKEVKEQLCTDKNSRTIDDYGFFSTLQKHLIRLHEQGYPKIVAHRMVLKRDPWLLIEFEWIAEEILPGFEFTAVAQLEVEEIKEEPIREIKEEPIKIGGKILKGAPPELMEKIKAAEEKERLKSEQREQREQEQQEQLETETTKTGE